MYELVSPVNPYAIIKYLGYFLISFSLILLVPAIAALFLRDNYAAMIYGTTSALTLVSGFTLYRILPEYELEVKDAIVVSALIFPISSFISAIPMSISNNMLFIDAFFESVSAVTTTGLSVAPADSGLIFLFARSWSQWIGGIGIIIIVVSVLVHPGTAAFRIYKAQYAQIKMIPNVIKTTRLLGAVYIFITVIAIVLFLLSGMSWFDAICHAFSSVSTGGFSTRANSIGGFETPLVLFTISIASLMGAVSFGLYLKYAGKPEKLLRNSELQWLLLTCLIGFFVLWYTAIENGDPYRTSPDVLFLAVSAVTTSGFSTNDISLYSDASKWVITVLMWIGGSTGSTAGGIKILRLIVLAKLIKIVFMRIFLPLEVITPLKVGKNVVREAEINNIIAFCSLYVGFLIFSSYIFMLFGIGSADAIFEVSSAIGTVGLSSGITGAAMPDILKLVLCSDMLLGRIEIIPLLILIMPGTWITRRRGREIK
ncbi:MAG: TrkH family potassium uptake protein [Methanolobus sp.]|nr:TrkH family potassium uptake protein [Methanolobus sp.]